MEICVSMVGHVWRYLHMFWDVFGHVFGDSVGVVEVCLEFVVQVLGKCWRCL